MKKLIVLSCAVAAFMTSCGNFGSTSDLQAQNDSLKVALANRDAEFDGIMSAFNEVQNGLREITVAEGRVDLSGDGISENKANRVKEDILFISEKLQANREQLAKLEKQLKNSNFKSAQLKKALESLTAELNEKQQVIETLQTELASKNIRIAELDEAVTGLTKNVSNLTAENAEKAAVVASQDKALNTAWFVFGTKSELKDQNILQKGDVLKSSDFNKNYFTQIDIRNTTEIKLYSKKAELLTTHPANTYALNKDDKGQLILKITKPNEFWSVSRYLVIQVK